MSVRVRYLTLNLRNLMDRWPERLPLLLAEFAALQPDVAGLQEVVFPLQQDRLLGASGDGQYATRRVAAWRPEVGNSLLIREPLAFGLTPETAADRLDLGHLRSAGRAELIIDDAATRLRVLNVHLHHEVGPDHALLRLAQTEAMLAWLASMPPVAATIVNGDFNATPGEPTYRRMVDAGFRSAFVEANGTEPDVTWPSGLQAPGMDTDGEPGCLDYIWVTGAVQVSAARLCFDRPATGDPTLYPSDHRGVTADLEIGA
ncbi:MAG: endonuclease/exonuclease/phosphatase family protein [Candidatus Limnocylindrales bacterium]